MIYSILALLVSYLYPFGSDTTSDVVLGITFLANILISVIMLPINIRLAGQLVMQVFKYRYICNHEATIRDRPVTRPRPRSRPIPATFVPAPSPA